MTYTIKQKEKYVTDIKTTVGCKNCGKEGPPSKLHLHHIDGERKVDTVSNMVSGGYSLEEVKNEIRKCEVLCNKCHGIHHHGRSKQHCIDALREVAEKLDKSPSQKEYKQDKKDDHPSYWTIQKKFGSWNKAKEAADLSVFADSRDNSHTKQDCIDAVQEVAETLDKSPSVSEYKRHKKEKHPSYITIRKKFGNWNKAKEAAGLSTFAKSSGNKTPAVDTQGQLSFDQFAE
jgi:hypothetical protein